MAFGTVTNNFETGQASGTAITAGNSGGTGAYTTAFGAVGNTDSTMTFDNTHVAHGTLACKIITGTANAHSFTWTTPLTGAPTTFYTRFYMYWTAVPAVNTILAKWEGGSNVLIGELVAATTGKLLFKDSAGTTQITMTNSFATNGWSRVECALTVSATVGTADLKLFNNPDSTAATEDDSIGSLNLTANGLNFLQIGQTAAIGTTETFWLDEVAVSDTSPVGPACPIAPVGARKTPTAVQRASIW